MNRILLGILTVILIGGVILAVSRSLDAPTKIAPRTKLGKILEEDREILKDPQSRDFPKALLRLIKTERLEWQSQLPWATPLIERPWSF